VSMTSERAKPRRLGLISSAALFAVSLVTCLVFGGAWALATNDAGIERARVRDEALQAGRTAIVNFNTLDYRDVERGLDRWEKYSTGPLRDEIRNGRRDYATQITQAKSTTTAEVLDAGLVELDEAAGKAKMIAVVQVEVSLEGQQPSVKRDRYSAELTREGDTWKLSAIGTVPVG
jgi:Mce-associated membrane protein